MVKETKEVMKEKPDGKKAVVKLQFRAIGARLVDGLTGSLTPVLPAFIVAGMFKMVVTLFGPSNFNFIPEESNVLTVLTLVGDACYYFLPMFVAWSAARKFQCSQILALVLAGIMIHPTLLDIVFSGEPFTVFGIPMYLVDYTQAVIPVVITMWAMSVIEKWVGKIVPDMLCTMLVPVLTILIMLPLALCLFGPACYYIMSLLTGLIIWLSDTIGVAAMAIIGGTWTFITLFGMHIPILTVLLPTAMSIGYDPVVFPATIVSGMSGLAVSMGYAIKTKDKEEKIIAWEYFLTMATTNIAQPFLYGVLLRNKKVFCWSIIGGAFGGFLAGIMHLRVFTFSGVGFPFLNPLRFGEDVVEATIACAITFIISLAMTLVFGIGTKKMVH